MPPGLSTTTTWPSTWTTTTGRSGSGSSARRGSATWSPARSRAPLGATRPLTRISPSRISRVASRRDTPRQAARRNASSRAGCSTTRVRSAASGDSATPDSRARHDDQDIARRPGCQGHEVRALLLTGGALKRAWRAPPKAPVSQASRTAAVAAPDPQRRLAPHRSTMLERFGLIARLLVRFAFAHVRVGADLVERVRQLATQGTVIYVMRYRSAIDYLLVNA